MRRPHRRRRARLGPGRSASTPRPSGSTSTALAAVAQPAVRPGDRRARRAAAAADDFDARFSATGARLPLHGAQPAGARPVPGAARRGTCPSRSTCALLRLGVRPAHRRARLLVVLPAPQAAATAREPPSLVRRVRRRRAGRDLGDGVLRFEIAATAFCHQMVRVDRGHARRRRPGPRCAPATCAGILRGPRPRRGRPARPAPRPVPVGGRLLTAPDGRRSAPGRRVRRGRDSRLP